MELIVAVYEDWGIGCDGTQPIALSADRKFFREMTKGAMVIVGRKTLADFPGGKPLPNRVNVVLTRNPDPMEGVVTCHSPQEAAQLAATADKAMVIGGGVGSAIAYPQAKALFAAGAQVDVIIGFRSKELVFM